jgi:hypothetical protein
MKMGRRDASSHRPHQSNTKDWATPTRFAQADRQAAAAMAATGRA